MSIGSSARANSMPPNPVLLSNAPTRPVSAREKAADGPAFSRRPSTAAASANPVVKTGFSSRVRQHRKASLPPRRSAFPQVGECRRRVIEEHHTETAQHHVEDPGPERAHLGVGHLEPGVSDASRSGEPARFSHLNPGEVGAESVPAAGGAGREDGHLTAAATDVENVLPVLDLRGGEQSRPQPSQHPLMPFTLLDEFPPAGSIPVPGLLRIHRHERHATSPA